MALPLSSAPLFSMSSALSEEDPIHDVMNSPTAKDPAAILALPCEWSQEQIETVNGQNVWNGYWIEALRNGNAETVRELIHQPRYHEQGWIDNEQELETRWLALKLALAQGHWELVRALWAYRESKGLFKREDMARWEEKEGSDRLSVLHLEKRGQEVAAYLWSEDWRKERGWGPTALEQHYWLTPVLLEGHGSWMIKQWEEQRKREGLENHDALKKNDFKAMVDGGRWIKSWGSTMIEYEKKQWQESTPSEDDRGGVEGMEQGLRSLTENTERWSGLFVNSHQRAEEEWEEKQEEANEVEKKGTLQSSDLAVWKEWIEHWKRVKRQEIALLKGEGRVFSGVFSDVHEEYLKECMAVPWGVLTALSMVKGEEYENGVNQEWSRYQAEIGVKTGGNGEDFQQEGLPWNVLRWEEVRWGLLELWWTGGVENREKVEAALERLVTMKENPEWIDWAKRVDGHRNEKRQDHAVAEIQRESASKPGLNGWIRRGLKRIQEWTGMSVRMGGGLSSLLQKEKEDQANAVKKWKAYMHEHESIKKMWSLLKGDREKGLFMVWGEEEEACYGKEAERQWVDWMRKTLWPWHTEEVQQMWLDQVDKKEFQHIREWWMVLQEHESLEKQMLPEKDRGANHSVHHAMPARARRL